MNKGFTLLECMIVLAIISTFTVVFSLRFKDIDLSQRYFVADYLYNQSYSISHKNYVYFSNNYSKYPIYFNAKGNVNMAQTIKINNHKIKIFLGTGCLYYE